MKFSAQDYRRIGNCYGILGVSSGATLDAVDSAFRRQAEECLAGHNTDAVAQAQRMERFKRLNMAHDILSDPDERRSYDAWTFAAENVSTSRFEAEARPSAPAARVGERGSTPSSLAAHSYGWGFGFSSWKEWSDAMAGEGLLESERQLNATIKSCYETVDRVTREHDARREAERQQEAEREEAEAARPDERLRGMRRSTLTDDDARRLEHCDRLDREADVRLEERMAQMSLSPLSYFVPRRIFWLYIRTRDAVRQQVKALGDRIADTMERRWEERQSAVARPQRSVRQAPVSSRRTALLDSMTAASEPTVEMSRHARSSTGPSQSTPGLSLGL
jgi:curved DNA-binding protein CbpA